MRRMPPAMQFRRRSRNDCSAPLLPRGISLIDADYVVVGSGLTGAVIARVGDTGIAKETKLHFEVREGVKTVNPMGYLPP